MTVPTILFVVALILALVEAFRSEGKSLCVWAVLFIAVGLLWSHLG